MAAKRRFVTCCTLILVVSLFAVAVPTTLATGITPVYVAGNPTCQDLGYDFGFKVDPPNAGTYNIDAFNTVTVTTDGIYFDWSSTLGMDAVISKGGPNANVYVYDPPAESFGDTGLHSPINPNNGNPFGLSHIEFCYDYEVDVTKDATTSYTRTFLWTIDKSVTPATWDLFTGDSGTSQYTVAVTKTGYIDSDWAVSGDITIENNTPFDATIAGVSDVVSGGINAPVDCGAAFPINVSAGGTLVCSYSTSLPDGSNRTNTATVTTSGSVGGGEASADVIFGEPTTLVNDSINVTDSNGQAWGPVSGDASWNYNRTFSCDGDEGTHGNTATITETGQSDDASVTVNCYDLTVTKDAATSLTRTWNWTITKTVTPEAWNLFTGDSGTSEYTVSVDKVDYTDSAWAVAGNITVHNPAPMAATINTVADAVSPAIAASVNCGVAFPYSLAAGGDLNCTYSADLPDDTTRTNTATATLQNYDYDKDLNPTADGTTDFSGNASVDFSGATVNEVNPSINVTDTNGQAWGPVSDDASWNYSRTFTCDADEGTHDNTATITETGQSDDASVTVNCYALEVSKNADTSLTRTWTWTIDKSADQTELTLSPGQAFTVNYTVEVDATSADSAWAVAGNITVHNPAPMAATINTVADAVSPAIAASVNCGVAFPYSLAASGDLNCTYNADLPDDTTRTNTATATLQNYDYDKDLNPTADGTTDFSGNASVDFSGATVNEVDECVDVYDSVVGWLGWVCAGDNDKTLEYSFDIGPFSAPDECGEHDVPNIASLVTNDTETTDEDDWNVHVTVPCDVGCTLTPGYWKTHSEFGPAPYDETWAALSNGASTLFFLSGQSYYNVLWTPPAGNAYYNLSFQYIAAQLNQLNGASIPPDVLTAFNTATGLFNTYTPAQIAALKGNNPVRRQFITLAGILGAYNEGSTGPGHCDEDSSSDR